MTMPTDAPLSAGGGSSKADPWGRGYLDLVESAVTTVHADGRGEIAVEAAVRAGLDVNTAGRWSFSPG